MNGNVPAVGSGNRARFARLAGLKRSLVDIPVRRFQDLKIRKKLIWTYIIVVLIPIFMVGMILTNGMRDMAIEQAIKEACTNTDRIQLRLNELTNRVTEISDRIYFSARTRRSFRPITKPGGASYGNISISASLRNTGAIMRKYVI